MLLSPSKRRRLDNENPSNNLAAEFLYKRWLEMEVVNNEMEDDINKMKDDTNKMDID